MAVKEGGRYVRSKKGGEFKRVAHTGPRADRYPRKQYAAQAEATTKTATGPVDQGDGQKES